MARCCLRTSPTRAHATRLQAAAAPRAPAVASRLRLRPDKNITSSFHRNAHILGHHRALELSLADDFNMAADAPRRSARARKPVTTYAEEQGEETTAPKPVSKRKRDVAKDDDASPEPRKKSKKAEATTTNSQDVKRLVTTEKRPPGERRPPQVWDVPKQLRKPKDPKAPGLAALLADTFEERYQRQVSKIKRLAPGQEETRLKA